MKKGFLAFVFCLLVVSGVFAQTKQESIKQLFHIMKTDSITEKTLTSMMFPIMNQMQSMDSASQVRFKEKMQLMVPVFKNITNKMLNEDMVVIYDKYFSQEEINDILSFYKSISGQKLINLTPDISKELITVMMEKYMPEIKKAIAEKFAEK